MADFFKPEDFAGIQNFNNSFMDESAAVECANRANQKIVTSFQSQDYKPKENEIFLYAVVDNFGRIYYTGHNSELAEAYIKDNCLKDRYVVELKGELNV